VNATCWTSSSSFAILLALINLSPCHATATVLRKTAEFSPQQVIYVNILEKYLLCFLFEQVASAERDALIWQHLRDPEAHCINKLFMLEACARE
jgi:hypothetical protein